MVTTEHPMSFDIKVAFPNARRSRVWEGGGSYLAERDGVPYVIIDERSMADFLGDDDQDLLNKLVHVIAFDNEIERSAYVEKHSRKAGAQDE